MNTTNRIGNTKKILMPKFHIVFISFAKIVVILE